MRHFNQMIPCNIDEIGDGNTMPKAQLPHGNEDNLNINQELFTHTSPEHNDCYNNLNLSAITGHERRVTMQVAFVGILCASFQCNNVNNRIKVWAKNNNEGKSKKHKGGRREITYELPPYAFTQSPDDYEHIKDPNKLLTVMWKDYADSTGDLDPKLNRPTRHYPAHHYRREIQQKIGWQRKESRVQDILRKATVPLPEDDCSMLPPNLRPRILEAFNKYEEWLNMSNARRSENEKTKQNVTDASPFNSIPMDQIEESDSEEENILDDEQDLNYEIADELEYWNDFEDSDITNFDG